MTDAEIKSMLDNKDIWMDGEEVVRRINIKLDFNKKKAVKTAEKRPTSKPSPAKTPRKRTPTKASGPVL